MSSPVRVMAPNNSNKAKEIENVGILFRSGLEVWNSNSSSSNSNNCTTTSNMTLKVSNSDLTPIGLLDTLANLASLQSPVSNGQSGGNSSPNSKHPYNYFPFSNNNNNDSSNNNNSSNNNSSSNNSSGSNNHRSIGRSTDELGPGGFTRGAKAAAANSISINSNSFSYSSSNSSSNSNSSNNNSNSSSSSGSSSSSISLRVAMDLETSNYNHGNLDSISNQMHPLFYHRPRAMSEPWVKSTASSASIIEGQHSYVDDNDDDNILPQMMEHYRTIYNKNGRIGIYTRDERNNIISRFHEKRKKRIWKKKIRYHCRKNLADRRIRVKGRFVKAEDMEVMGLMGSLKTMNDEGLNDNHDTQISNNNGTNNNNGGSVNSSGKKGKGKAKQTRRPPLPPKSSFSTPTGNTSSTNVNPNIQFDINAAAAVLEAKHADKEGNETYDGLPAKRMRRHSIAY